KCIHWKSLQDLILAHLDARKRVDVFTLTLEHIDDAVSDLFDRLDKRVTPISAILVETFRSLSACWRAGEGRFIGCAQILLYRSRQFIPVTQGLAQCEFMYKGDN
ncbi:hypothetical protein Gohar_013947, partial [Gossypium harknessii]|nr:hypothetical protein [Gossypium harknessii]